MGGLHDLAAVEQVDDADAAVTEPDGALNDRVEHGLNIGRRAGDDPQDLACRGLLFLRFSQIAVACLKLL
jgi:hypothetical protein